MLAVENNSLGLILVCFLNIGGYGDSRLLLWLDIVPVLAFECVAGVFSPCSNRTCNVILAVHSLALARRKREERQLLKWLENNYIWEFDRESL